jgi:hypothetical protein
MEDFDPAPGSQEAVAPGCTCSVQLNDHGRGASTNDTIGTSISRRTTVRYTGSRR